MTPHLAIFYASIIAIILKLVTYNIVLLVTPYIYQ